jgi:hypothetical protein
MPVLRQSCFLAWALLASPGATFAKGPVAVVASLAGGANMQLTQARTAIPVHTLDWLDAGARLEVQPKSTMKLILLNGRTYQLSEGAKATVGADSLTGVNAQVHELDRLPPIPRLAPIAGNTPETPGVTAIRTDDPLRVKSLYPNQVWAIASQVTLTFAVVPRASSYVVNLDDDSGNMLLRVTSQANSVAVPADALKSASRYTWRVRAFAKSGVVADEGGEFWTVSQEDLDRRAAFAAALSAEDPPMRLALLAGVDQQVGLLAEACGELESALRLRPSDPALESALASAKAALDAARNR